MPHNTDKIFISHSSLDKDVLRKIKQLIQKGTVGFVDVFLSSDGQSIPFGSNWIYGIEKALNSTKLMFVAITPNSVDSKWIHFEAGFAYAKDVRVVGVPPDLRSGLKFKNGLMRS